MLKTVANDFRPDPANLVSSQKRRNSVRCFCNRLSNQEWSSCSKCRLQISPVWEMKRKESSEKVSVDKCQYNLIHKNGEGTEWYLPANLRSSVFHFFLLCLGRSTEFTSRLRFPATLLSSSISYWSEMTALSASTFAFIYTKMSTTKRRHEKVSLCAEYSLAIRHNNALWTLSWHSTYSAPNAWDTMSHEWLLGIDFHDNMRTLSARRPVLQSLGGFTFFIASSKFVMGSCGSTAFCS